MVALLASTAIASAANFDHSHTTLDTILKQHVTEKHLVDYAALKRDRAGLDAYLASLGQVSAAAYRGWSRDQQLAFLINLYNAATLQLIIDEYPLKSIRDIGFLPGAAWRKDFVKLFGDTVDLDHIEHGMIRKDFQEPRIHFALVCAAWSCPPLRREAYVAERLDAQLTAQAKTFLRDTTKNRVDTAERTAYLSQIFDWYGGDFGDSSSEVLAYLRPFFDESNQQALDSGASKVAMKIRYLDYDWRLNDAK